MHQVEEGFCKAYTYGVLWWCGLLNLLQSRGCELSGALCCIRWRVSTRSTLTARWCRPWSVSSTALSPASTSTSPETGKSGSSTPLSPPSTSTSPETGKSVSSTALSPPSTSTSPETGKSGSSTPLSPVSTSTSLETGKSVRVVHQHLSLHLLRQHQPNFCSTSCLHELKLIRRTKSYTSCSWFWFGH